MPTGSSICFIASIGAFEPFPLIGVYSISKTALLGLTKCLANELAPKGIRVNCLAPGVIKTNFSKMIWSKKGGERLNPALLVKRNGTIEDCGAATAFLCSDDASYISGE